MSNRHTHAVDRLYFWLGLFTNAYLLAIAAEFFYNLHLRHPTVERLLDAFSEPYLGALAVYVVLKEIRKRRSGSPESFHRGERFVYGWLGLLIITTLAVAFTDRYRVDAAYQAVIQNSLAALTIYLGARIHRP